MKRKIQISLALDSSQVEELDKLAYEEHKSRSETVRELLDLIVPKLRECDLPVGGSSEKRVAAQIECLVKGFKKSEPVEEATSSATGKKQKTA